LEVTPFEEILALMAHEGDLTCSFSLTVADRLSFCNTTFKRAAAFVDERKNYWYTTNIESIR
jgi:hypothetical protein